MTSNRMLKDPHHLRCWKLFTKPLLIKPTLISLTEDMKKLSLLKLKELIALQQQTEQNTKILKEKKDQLAGLQSKINEVHHVLHQENFEV